MRAIIKEFNMFDVLLGIGCTMAYYYLSGREDRRKQNISVIKERRRGLRSLRK